MDDIGRTLNTAAGVAHRCGPELEIESRRTSTMKTVRLLSIDRAVAVAEHERLELVKNPDYVEDWSADGKYIVYGTWSPNPTDLWAVPLAGDRKPFPVVQSPFHAAIRFSASSAKNRRG